ncbi:hypothetical protein ACET95_06445 [Aeromonas veronii]|uniref:hypothetical protein n=1 Tax=Aeromonas veronii TaxID=654 RepID=UPI0011A32E10|nr:hypothetical protein [Aeromonas veronii]
MKKTTCVIDEYILLIHNICTYLIHIGRDEMYKYGVELFPKCVLTPVTLGELRASIAEVQDVFDELHYLAHGSAIDSDTDRDSRLERCRLWPQLAYVWKYAEQGIYSDDAIPSDPDAFFSDAATLLSAINGYNAYQGETVGQAIIKVIIKFCARIKLDFNSNFETALNSPFGDAVTLQCAWFPQVAMKDLTLLELALLAGMTNMRSVRNAQYVEDEGLNFYKDGTKVLVTVADARTWLAGRTGFVSSTNLPTADSVVY